MARQLYDIVASVSAGVAAGSGNSWERERKLEALLPRATREERWALLEALLALPGRAFSSQQKRGGCGRLLVSFFEQLMQYVCRDWKETVGTDSRRSRSVPAKRRRDGEAPLPSIAAWLAQAVTDTTTTVSEAAGTASPTATETASEPDESEKENGQRASIASTPDAKTCSATGSAHDAAADSDSPFTSSTNAAESWETRLLAVLRRGTETCVLHDVPLSAAEWLAAIRESSPPAALHAAVAEALFATLGQEDWPAAASTSLYAAMLFCASASPLRRRLLVAMLRAPSAQLLLPPLEIVFRQERAYADEAQRLLCDATLERWAWHSERGVQLLLALASLPARFETCVRMCMTSARHWRQDREMAQWAPPTLRQRVARQTYWRHLRQAAREAGPIASVAFSLMAALLDVQALTAAEVLGADASVSHCARLVPCVLQAMYAATAARLQSSAWSRLLECLITQCPAAFLEADRVSWIRQCLDEPRPLATVLPLLPYRPEWVGEALLTCRKGLHSGEAPTRRAAIWVLVRLGSMRVAGADASARRGLLSDAELRAVASRALTTASLASRLDWYTAMAAADVTCVAASAWTEMLETHIRTTFHAPTVSDDDCPALCLGTHWLGDSLGMALSAAAHCRCDQVLLDTVQRLARLHWVDVDLGGEDEREPLSAEDGCMGVAVVEAAEAALAVLPSVVAEGDHTGGGRLAESEARRVAEALGALRQSGLRRLGTHVGRLRRLRLGMTTPTIEASAGKGAEGKRRRSSSSAAPASGSVSGKKASASATAPSAAADLWQHVPVHRALQLSQWLHRGNQVGGNWSSLASLALEALAAKPSMEVRAPEREVIVEECLRTAEEALHRQLPQVVAMALTVAAAQLPAELAADAEPAAKIYRVLGQMDAAVDVESARQAAVQRLETFSCRLLADEHAVPAATVASLEMLSWLARPTDERLRTWAQRVLAPPSVAEIEGGSVNKRRTAAMLSPLVRLACDWVHASPAYASDALPQLVRETVSVLAPSTSAAAADRLFSLLRAVAHEADAALARLEWGVTRGVQVYLEGALHAPTVTLLEAWMRLARGLAIAAEALCGNGSGNTAKRLSLPEHAEDTAVPAVATVAPWHCIEAVARAQLHAFKTLTLLAQAVLRYRLPLLRSPWQRVVQLAAARLSQSAYDLMQSAHTPVADESHRKRVRESTLFPNLVYQIEVCERALIAISRRWNDVELMRPIRRAAARDFKIAAPPS
ncbi:hypothetical protein CDCA_CDCA04G1238 [Cyanidium caldarium]|uniref:FANCI solenoid 4 domain-containing protein n=1 Tax=Cyanidium caldarium TaxID=2771 RepID=A0AAV9ISH6_CYACA|nr:hypothetical protein CDCA_CDCA04G1238 [Cyanidium caldarium]